LKSLFRVGIVIDVCLSLWWVLLQQLVDFIKEVVGEPTVLVGNSIGSLACLIASAGKPNPNPA